jgi:exonuclease 3'-5' domain-containing protein 1
MTDEAFSTCVSNGHTLKSMLESEGISKVYFNIRNDSDALYSLYGIYKDLSAPSARI